MHPFLTFNLSGQCITCGEFKDDGIAAANGRIECQTCFEIDLLEKKLAGLYASCAFCKLDWCRTCEWSGVISDTEHTIYNLKHPETAKYEELPF